MQFPARILMAAGIVCVTCGHGSQAAEQPDPSASGTGTLAQDVSVPAAAPAARLLALPLAEQVCESDPPTWALSSRESPIAADWPHAPLFLDRQRLLWGRHVLDPATGAVLDEFPFGDEADLITRAWLSRNRKYLLVSRTTRMEPNTFVFPPFRLQVWDVEARCQRGRDILVDEFFGAAEADVTSDGNTVAVASQSEVGLWDAETGARLRSLPVDLDEFEKGYEGRPPFFRPEFLRFSPDDRWLVVFSPNNVIYARWRAEDDAQVLHVGRRLQAFAFSPDSRLLAEGPGPRRNLHLRQLGSFDIVRTLFDEVDSPMITTGLAFAPDGGTLIASNEITVDESKLAIPHRIHFWNVQTGELVRQMETPLYLPRWIDVSPDGRWLAVRLDGHETTVLAVWPVSKAGE